MSQITTTEAATRLGVSRSWLRRLILDGKLKAEKKGRDWFIEEGELESIIQKPKGTGRPRKGEARLD